MSAPIVLVTGGAGFIGSHVAERFARGGFSVRILDDLSSGSADNCAPGWSLERGDVCDAKTTSAAVAGADVVVHLAAFTSVPESFERHTHCYRTNVHGSYNVLEACAEHRVRRLVFASSSAVYAELPDAPRSELDTPDPVSPYAVSKLEGEHLLAIFSERRGLSSAAMRFFNVYGPRQPADSAYAAAVPIFFERCLRGDPITIYGDGKQTRDFVFVSDVADAIFRAAERSENGVFNVGSGEPTPILDLADTIQALTRSSSPRSFEPLRAGDLRSSTADVRFARERLDWSAARSLGEGLAATLEWQEAQRARNSGK